MINQSYIKKQDFNKSNKYKFLQVYANISHVGDIWILQIFGPYYIGGNMKIITKSVIITFVCLVMLTLTATAPAGAAPFAYITNTNLHVHRPPAVTLSETPEEFHISSGLR